MLSPSAPSFATAGTDALSVLEAGGNISFAVPPMAGAPANVCAPVAGPVDMLRLSTLTRESELVAAITPLLRAARDFDAAGVSADPFARVLINSENVPWLDALDAPLRPEQRRRPDLFATWAPFWCGRTEEGRGPTGGLASRALQLDGCAREFYEAKVGVGALTATDFGQLVDYHSRVPGFVRGMLFNARHFWLYLSRRNLPVSLVKSEWGAPGSRALLRDFFDAAPEPPLLPLLRFLCRELRVAPHPLSEARTEPIDAEARAGAFLGAGASARVFCVRDAAAGALRALKVSTTLSRSDLEYEFSSLQRAAAAGAPVVPVVADSLRVLVDERGYLCGGGFLLRDVCKSACVDSAARCAAAFECLRVLHSCGFAHGDARLPNLLLRGSALLWIDMREAAVGGGDDSAAQ